MIEIFCPSLRVPSIHALDLDKLKARGIEGLIVDLDNTLIKWGQMEIPDSAAQWVEIAKSKGFKLCIASNGVTSRVEPVSAFLGIPFVSKAVKPRKKAFHRALEQLGTRAERTAVIGDQIFTDILGGNRLGLYTILIDPLSSHELPSTRMVRRVERTVMSRLKRKGLLNSDQEPERPPVAP